MWPFDMHLWIALIVAVPTTAAVYWIFAMFQCSDEIENISIGTSVSQVLQILVYQGIDLLYMYIVENLRLPIVTFIRERQTAVILAQ